MREILQGNILLLAENITENEMKLASLFLIALVIIVFYSIDNDRKKQAEALERAKKDYREALEALEKDPENNEFKRRALAYGRTRAILEKKAAGRNSTVTVFDEAALANDISIRRGKSPTSPSESPKASGESPKGEPAKRIMELKQLFDAGAISQEEFSEKRRSILTEL